MNIAVAGTGYVGLSIAILLAQHNSVKAVDIVPEKVNMINNRRSPIIDKEIEEYLSEKSRIANGLAPSEETSFQLDFEYQHDAAINSRVIFLNH